jgi:hypothetical protein
LEITLENSWRLNPAGLMPVDSHANLSADYDVGYSHKFSSFVSFVWFCPVSLNELTFIWGDP